jgi:uncharacterized membrane protein
MSNKRYTKEKNYRSIIKAVSYRIFGTFATVLISYVITGDAKSALSIGGLELSSKIIIYYFHERIWENIKFGKAKPIDYEI